MLRSSRPPTMSSARPRSGISGVRDLRLLLLFLVCLFGYSILGFDRAFEVLLFVCLLLLAEILQATSAVRPRADVAYCIHALARRLAKTHNWAVRLLARSRS